MNQLTTSLPPTPVHPTAIPLSLLASAAQQLSDERLIATYGSGFFVLLSQAPSPRRRPHLTQELATGPDSGAILISAALPLRPRIGVMQSFLVVGRNESCDVPIFDGTVSKAHALIERVDGGYRISDCNSRNGTMVDGAAVASRAAAPAARLLPGCSVRFGNVLTSFVDVPRLRRLLHALASTR